MNITKDTRPDFFDNTFAMILVGTIGVATIAGLAVFLIRHAG